MEKVIPPGLNYADIKPEAIENQIRMVKFLPISNVQNQKANDVVRFNLQGNGFYDPYSAYIKIRVAYDMTKIGDPVAVKLKGEGDQFAAPDNEIISGAFLDRSAHSLINRLVIRSQGTELERIEHYDVLAAMINDMIYDTEQRQLHGFEGFAYNTFNMNSGNFANDPVTKALSVLGMVCQGEPEVNSHFGDNGFYKIIMPAANDADAVTGADNVLLTRAQRLNTMAVDSDNYFFTNVAGVPKSLSGLIALNKGAVTYTASPTIGATLSDSNLMITSPGVMEFCIPLYSGIIGVLMPDKKLLPLSLLPLEVEFTLNPHAFYTVGNTQTRSAYTIQSFEIWTHTLFFEQELHRSLETVVAENGIFLHYTSFYLTPINSYSATIPKYHQLGCFLKSVEALHWVFLYQGFYSDNGQKKLHFASHNLFNLQLRNGMDLIPSEPLMPGGTRGTGPTDIVGASGQLQIELMKAWNKMHDVFACGAINSFNYNIDAAPQLLAKPLKVLDFINQQKLTGRCQYGLSLVGEEIGQNKTIISGKKTVLPFDLNFDGSKDISQSSIMLCYLRADFIVYVRPDLVVTRLGL